MYCSLPANEFRPGQKSMDKLSQCSPSAHSAPACLSVRFDRLSPTDVSCPSSSVCGPSPRCRTCLTLSFPGTVRRLRYFNQRLDHCPGRRSRRVSRRWHRTVRHGGHWPLHRLRRSHGRVATESQTRMPRKSQRGRPRPVPLGLLSLGLRLLTATKILPSRTTALRHPSEPSS